MNIMINLNYSFHHEQFKNICNKYYQSLNHLIDSLVLHFFINMINFFTNIKIIFKLFNKFS